MSDESKQLVLEKLRENTRLAIQIALFKSIQSRIDQMYVEYHKTRDLSLEYDIQQAQEQSNKLENNISNEIVAMERYYGLNVYTIQIWEI